MELRVSALDVKLFTVSNQFRMFVAEASDLRGNNLMQRLYDDACDAGFALWNAATNTVTRWAFAENEHDAEGDLVCTYFVPTSETLRKHPQLQGWKVHILND